MFLVLRRAFLRASVDGRHGWTSQKKNDATLEGRGCPTKMLARRARGNTTVLYTAGFYGRTPYARADGRNLCAEIGGTTKSARRAA